MSQKTNPTSLRLQRTNKRFSSCWYSDYFYSERSDQDFKIRSYIETMSRQIGHLQIFSFLQLHYRRLSLYLFFLDVRAIRQERGTVFKISRERSTQDAKQNRKSPLLLSSLDWRDRMRMSERKTEAWSDGGSLSQCNEKDKESQKGKSLSEQSSSEKTASSPLNNRRRRESISSHLQQGLISSLFRQGVMYTCWKGRTFPDLIEGEESSSYEVVQAKLNFCLNGSDQTQRSQEPSPRRSHTLGALTERLRNLNVGAPFVEKKKPDSLLTCVLPKHEVKRLPTRVYAFGPFCATQRFKESVSLPKDSTHPSLFPYSAHQKLVESSIHSQHLAERRKDLSMSRRGARPEIHYERGVRGCIGACTSVCKHPDLDILISQAQDAAKRSSLTERRKIRDLVPSELQRDCVVCSHPTSVRVPELHPHHLVSLYPIRIVQEAQSALFLVKEIVDLLQRGISFRQIKDQMQRELTKDERIKGVRISSSGRVGVRSKRAQKTKTQSVQWGERSLHVFSSSLSFAKESALTPFGKVGIKVWICYK